MNTKIIEFHHTEIYCPNQDGQIYVAIRSVCQALDLNYSGQIQRLKRDTMWSQLCVPVHTVGRDNKQREMICLPLQFVFGWILTVDTKLVKEAAREELITYKVECCQVLYEYFWNGRNAEQKKEKYLHSIQEEIEQLTHQRKGHWPYDQGEEGGV